jgi:hypothetical protein
VNTKTWSPVQAVMNYGLGIRYCSFMRLGDGQWVGAVVDGTGLEYDLKQLPSSWEAVRSSDNRVTKAVSLELVLQRALAVAP